MFVRLSGYRNILIDVSEQVDLGFEEHDKRAREALHYAKYRFSLTDSVKLESVSWDSFAEQPMEQKCLAFFSTVDREWPE